MKTFSISPHYHIVYSEKPDGDLRESQPLRQFLAPLELKHAVQFENVLLQHGSKVRTSRVDLGDHEGDAMINTDPSKGIGFIVGDCIPIIITAKKNSLMAIVHGGWRPLLQNVLLLTLQGLIHQHNVQPKDLDIWIGPGLRKDHNLMDHEPVQFQFPEWKQFVEKNGEEYSVDLIGFIKQQCYDVGISEEQIVDSGICTYCESETFYSHRRSTNEQDINGRFYVGVWKTK